MKPRVDGLGVFNADGLLVSQCRGLKKQDFLRVEISLDFTVVYHTILYSTRQNYTTLH